MEEIELEKSLTIEDFRLSSLKALKIFLAIKKKPATGSYACDTKFLVCFDVSLGNLQLALFDQCQEIFSLTYNLMRYEAYAKKYCIEH